MRAKPGTGLIYIHVPKCGGSSFGAALRLRHIASQATIDLRQSRADVTARFPDLAGEDRIEAEYRLRAEQMHRLVARGTRCISAHALYDRALHEANPGYAHVTLLRDPVDRFVSHYRYLQRRHPDPARPDTLPGFLDCEDAARIASQYLLYFGGKSQARCPDLPRAIDRARHALSRFALIGDLSDPAGFAAGLRRLTGGPLPVLRRNRAPTPTRVPAALRPRIERLCAADIAIYTAARAMRAAA